ncbi:MAG: hypothetical protein AAF226_00665 [Verrucomicrobiota bacterium]
MRLPIVLALIALGLNSTTRAEQVFQISWPTQHAAPPAKLAPEQQNLLPLIRLGIASVPEANLMSLVMAAGTATGLDPEEAKLLQNHITRRYQTLAKDPTFAQLPSALPYCFSETRPTNGLASIYVPPNIREETPCILFLHSFGGSFSLYLHLMAETFPDHLIICPAYGITSYNISSTYLKECVAAASKKIGVSVSQPLLIGISAGGFGAFQEYANQHTSYRGLICMAAHPPAESLRSIPPQARIRLVVGQNEFFVKENHFQRSVQFLEQRCSNFQTQLMSDEDHFFLLTSQTATQILLKRWDKEFAR